MVLFCENSIAIEITNNPAQHEQTKDIELDRNCIKDNLDSCVVEITYIMSVNLLADIMTNVVTIGPFHMLLSKLGIYDIYTPTLGRELKYIRCTQLSIN
jgi:hypothetical protein